MLASPCSLFPTAPLPFTSILQLHWTWDTLFFHSCLWSGCVPCELLSLPATSALMTGPSSVLPCITALVMILSVYFYFPICHLCWMVSTRTGFFISPPLLFIIILLNKYEVNGWMDSWQFQMEVTGMQLSVWLTEKQSTLSLRMEYMWKVALQISGEMVDYSISGVGLTA